MTEIPDFQRVTTPAAWVASSYADQSVLSGRSIQRTDWCVTGPMSDFNNFHKEQPSATLNRRKPENRWVRILRDAEWDQNETVRRWLKFARHLLGDGEDKEPDDSDVPQKNSNDLKKAA